VLSGIIEIWFLEILEEKDMAVRLATINQLRNGYVHPFFGSLFAFPAFTENRTERKSGPSFDVFESAGEYTIKSDFPDSTRTALV